MAKQANCTVFISKVQKIAHTWQYCCSYSHIFCWIWRAILLYNSHNKLVVWQHCSVSCNNRLHWYFNTTPPGHPLQIINSFFPPFLYHYPLFIEKQSNYWRTGSFILRRGSLVLAVKNASIREWYHTVIKTRYKYFLKIYMKNRFDIYN